MLTVALSTLRVRWVSFVGTMVALTCGIGLMATAILVIHATGNIPGGGQQRYADAPVVILPANAIVFTGSGGNTESLAPDPPLGLPAALVTAVGKTGRTVADHTFYAQLAGGPADEVGRGWSAAQLGGYRLVAGRAPQTADQVVVGGGDPALVGRSMPLTTAVGPRVVTITGVTAPVPYEQAVFFTDAEAAALSPRIDALAAFGPAGAVSAAAAPWSAGQNPVQVLTGAERSLADPYHVAVVGQLQNVEDPLGLAAGVAGFVAIFVVGGTFALSIAQRRRELALLRLVGATRKQVRRLVRYEALLVGLFASVVGCAISVVTGPLCGRWLIDHDLVPAGFNVSIVWWGLLIASLTGLFTAMVGVVVSSVRAGLFSPADALREAASERRSRAVLAFRWVVGGIILIVGLIAEADTALIQPQSGADASDALALVLVVVGAFAVLGGALAKPATALVTGVPTLLGGLVRRARGSGGQQEAESGAAGFGASWAIARQTAATAFGRTAATTTPVIIMVALAGTLLGTVGTINEAQVTATRQELSGSTYIVSPAGTPGLSQALVRRVESVPGTASLAVTPTTVFTEENDGDGRDTFVAPQQAAAVDPAILAAMSRLPVSSGSLADLGPGGIVIDSTWPGSPKVGQNVSVWLADGTPKTLRVAAILAHTGSSTAQAYVDSSLVPAGLASRVQIELMPGADPQRTLAALNTAVAGYGAQVLLPAQISAQASDADEKASWTGMEMLLGLSLLYAAIALANTLVMTVSDRRRELILLRLVGATKAQVFKVVALETLMCIAAGTVIGALAVAIGVGGSWAALTRLVGSTPAVLPFAALGWLFAGCLVIALIAAVVPVMVVLRETQKRGMMDGLALEAS